MEKRLAREGITLTFKYSGGTDVRQGVIFGKDGYSFNGSKIDRQFGFSKLGVILNANAQREHEMAAREVHDVSAQTPVPMPAPSPQPDYGYHSTSNNSQSYSGDSLLSGMFDFELGPGEDHPDNDPREKPRMKKK